MIAGSVSFAQWLCSRISKQEPCLSLTVTSTATLRYMHSLCQSITAGTLQDKVVIKVNTTITTTQAHICTCLVTVYLSYE
jgi:hypothetical protein